MNLPDASCPPGLPFLDFLGLYLDPGGLDLAHLMVARGWVCLSGTSSEGRRVWEAPSWSFCWQESLCREGTNPLESTQLTSFSRTTKAQTPMPLVQFLPPGPHAWSPVEIPNS